MDSEKGGHSKITNIKTRNRHIDPNPSTPTKHVNDKFKRKATKHNFIMTSLKSYNFREGITLFFNQREVFILLGVYYT